MNEEGTRAKTERHKPCHGENVYILLYMYMFFVADLTELLPKYAPTIVKLYPPSFKEHMVINGGQDGKIWGVPFSAGNMLYSEITGVEPSEVAVYETPQDPYEYIFVRDDILKRLYPNAKTQNEIEEIFMANGGFTEDEIFDVPINSADDFYNMLYRIKELNLTEGGKPVFPTYIRENTDNFNLMNQLWATLGGRGSTTATTGGMFTYWDYYKGECGLMLTTDTFKQQMKKWNQLVRDGIVPEESFIDTRAQFSEKLNGQYAVLYGYTRPDNQALKNAGKQFQYRKVYLKIPPTDGFFKIKPAAPGFKSVSFSKKLTREQVIQLISWIDFQVSELGQKLMSWGPKSANLWSEENGERKFVLKELEDYALFNINPDIGADYNLRNGLGDFSERLSITFPFYYNYISRFNPAVVCERTRTTGDYEKYFGAGWVVENAGSFFTPLEFAPTMYTMTDELVLKVWGSRNVIEDALIKTVAAKSDREFEQYESQLQDILKENGWDQEMLDAATKEFKERNPKTLKNVMPK